MTRAAAALSVVLLLTACSDNRPPAPTAEQADQLNEVEELLNEQAEAENGARPAD